jgi:hypothetical protein
MRTAVSSVLFREEVAAFHGLSARAEPIDAQRSSVSCIESIERTTLGPQMQHRALDPAGSRLVGAVVFDIDSWLTLDTPHRFNECERDRDKWKYILRGSRGLPGRDRSA